eukprot:6468325-Prymnesium_polylepis.1
MLRLDLERECSGETLSIIAPRAHAGLALVRRKPRRPALVFTQDAAVWAMIRQLLEGRQIVIAVEDADRLMFLSQLLARADFGRFCRFAGGVGGWIGRRLACTADLRTCSEPPVLRAVGTCLIDVEADFRSVVPGALLLRRDLWYSGHFWQRPRTQAQ